MTKKLFGTDGIRGKANTPPMNSETMLALARVLAQKLLPQRPAQVVIGKDTRASGYMLETALASGLISEGVDILYTGPIPTPAIPFLVRERQASLGIMLTASHNPWQDNGIKVFDDQGHKLSDFAQETINDHIHRAQPSQSAHIGTARHSLHARKHYMAQVCASVPADFTLSGLKIVLDCAHGATYRIAPELFARFNPQELITLHDSPNGQNINLDCGATQPEALQKAVLEQHADIGLAFDGDGDRLIAVDEQGNVLDGDQIMAALCQHWSVTENFRGDLVCTVMSNKGMDRFLAGMGITVHRTPVGDRHVTAQMRKIGARFGGEQSGHLIFRDHGMSGDGMLAALQLLKVLKIQGIPASHIGQTFPALAQRMINVPVPTQAMDLSPAIAEAEKLVGSVGQILVRPSGTEPILRIMAQAETAEIAEAAVSHIAYSFNFD